MSKLPQDRVPEDFKPGSLIGFVYAPKRGDRRLPQDVFVLMMAMEIRTTGQGEGIWGPNMYLLPGLSTQRKVFNLVADEKNDRVRIGLELHANRSSKKAFGYYHKLGIISPILILNKEHLKELK